MMVATGRMYNVGTVQKPTPSDILSFKECGQPWFCQKDESSRIQQIRRMFDMFLYMHWWLFMTIQEGKREDGYKIVMGINDHH